MNKNITYMPAFVKLFLANPNNSMNDTFMAVIMINSLVLCIMLAIVFAWIIWLVVYVLVYCYNETSYQIAPIGGKEVIML